MAVRATILYWCPGCHEVEIAMEPFVGECNCWFCGRRAEAAHACYADGDCIDYAMEDLGW
jgi:hypothetical protein